MTNTASAETGANVRAEMARRKVSQTDMAAQVGMTQSALSKRLRGAIPFDINELTSIAAVLDLPLDTLLLGVGSIAGERESA